MDSEEAWDDFRMNSSNFGKASFSEKLDAIAAAVQESNVTNQRIAKVIPKIMGDEAAIDAVNAGEVAEGGPMGMPQEGETGDMMAGDEMPPEEGAPEDIGGAPAGEAPEGVPEEEGGEMTDEELDELLRGLLEEDDGMDEPGEDEDMAVLGEEGEVEEGPEAESAETMEITGGSEFTTALQNLLSMLKEKGEDMNLLTQVRQQIDAILGGAGASPEPEVPMEEDVAPFEASEEDAGAEEESEPPAPAEEESEGPSEEPERDSGEAEGGSEDSEPEPEKGSEDEEESEPEDGKEDEDMKKSEDEPPVSEEDFAKSDDAIEDYTVSIDMGAVPVTAGSARPSFHDLVRGGASLVDLVFPEETGFAKSDTPVTESMPDMNSGWEDFKKSDDRISDAVDIKNWKPRNADTDPGAISDAKAITEVGAEVPITKAGEVGGFDLPKVRMHGEKDPESISSADDVSDIISGDAEKDPGSIADAKPAVSMSDADDNEGEERRLDIGMVHEPEEVRKTSESQGVHIPSLRDLMDIAKSGSKPGFRSAVAGEIVKPDLGKLENVAKSQRPRVQAGHGVDPMDVIAGDLEDYNNYISRNSF